MAKSQAASRPEHRDVMGADDTGADEFCTLASGITLCFRSHGPRGGEPLLLIAGMGLDLTWWPEPLIAGLVRRGHRVIAFDNRDVGRSSLVRQRRPSVAHFLLRRPRADGYDLGDMADDAAELLERLGIERAHVTGMSMGGMIAQMVAARHPQRVASLISIASTTGNHRVGQPALSTLLRLVRPPARTAAQAMARDVVLLRHVTTGPYGFDYEEARAYSARSWQRGARAEAQAGAERHINAIFKSGDRTAALTAIRSPTLVIHGDRDPMVDPSGGKATAEAIAGAELVTIEGMRHSFPRQLVPRLVALIANHAQRHACARLADTGA